MEIRETLEYSSWMGALLDRQAKARILVRITRLAQGNPGDVKPVGNGVSELRLTYGPGYRIYYLQRDEELIILLVGGDKSYFPHVLKCTFSDFNNCNVLILRIVSIVWISPQTV